MRDVATMTGVITREGLRADAQACGCETHEGGFVKVCVSCKGDTSHGDTAAEQAAADVARSRKAAARTRAKIDERWSGQPEKRETTTTDRWGGLPLERK